MISRELVAASTRPLILSVLADGENYGYALIQRIAELSCQEIHWTEGMLYPVLHRLEQEGLIESRWQATDGGRRRKYYRLKQGGRVALAGEQRQWKTVHHTLTKLWQTAPSST